MVRPPTRGTSGRGPRRRPLLEHQMRNVEPGSSRPAAREPFALAQREIPLDLLVDAADRLDSPVWSTEPVTAMSCRIGMPERLDRIAYTRWRRRYRPRRPRRSARRRSRRSARAASPARRGPQVAGEDEHALVVDAPGHVRLALDVDDPSARSHRGDPPGRPKPSSRGRDGQAVDLAHGFRLSIDQHGAVGDLLGELLLGQERRSCRARSRGRCVRC